MKGSVYNMVTRINKIKTFTCRILDHKDVEIPEELEEFIKNKEIVSMTTTTYSTKAVGSLIANYIVYTIVYNELVS